jgi:hypothetical protein
MAIVVGQRRSLNAVELLSRSDTAIDHDKSDWEAYAEDPIGNRKALAIKPNETPTIFLCNFEMTGKEAARAKNSMITGIDEDRNARMAYGQWQYSIVQMVLKDIRNPPGVDGVIDFKKDGRGWVSEKTMTLLEKQGIVAEIFNHYISMTQSETRGHEKN